MKARSNKRRGRKAASRSAAPKRFRQDHLTALCSLLAGRDDVRQGHMFGFPAFFVGRRMFACVYGDGIGIKVPGEMAASLLRRPDTEPFRPYGKPVMREWVKIKHARPEDYQADLDVFLAAIAFAVRPSNTERRS